MKRFLSLIVVLMLAFGVKAQTTAPDFFCIDDYERPVHLYDILDNDQYAFLYFFIPNTEDQEGQFSQIIAETYYNYGANQDEVYFIGIAPTGDSLSANWWSVDYQVDFPIIHKFTEGDDVHAICESYGAKFLATVRLIAPDRTIIINDVWPINSTQHLIGEIDAAIEAHKNGTLSIAELGNNCAIYPNPVNDRLYIATENEVEEVVVYDIFGRRQELSAVSHQLSAIDVSNLNSGIYFVKVVTSEGEIVKRFVKK